MCLKCKDTGYIENYRSPTEYERIAKEEGILMAGWIQLHDAAFPYKRCDCNPPKLKSKLD